VSISNQNNNEALFQRASKAMPGGVSHEFRYFSPYPIYVTHAEGAYKWDANGRRFIDYKMGSGSQLLGHCHPDVVEAITDQAKQTPFTSDCHELEIQWAESVNALFPSADLTRFTASGTEATMLALRLGRAFSGRPRILRIDGHYHGWHDHVLKGISPGHDAPLSLGVPEEVSRLVTVVPADLTAVQVALEDEQVGTVIVEASGASYGSIPLPEGFLAGLRKYTSEVGSVLIFDEIITGFRWAPGGLQARDGIVPDLTTLSKILTGGLPGGAVAGRLEIMSLLDPRLKRDEFKPPVSHKGTFNGSPLVAAGAIAAMKHISGGEPQARADAMAKRLRSGLNGVLDRRGVPGVVYGDSSTFHIWFGNCNRTVSSLSPIEIRGLSDAVVNGLRSALLERGVDLMSYTSGVTSASHEEADIDYTLDAFDSAVVDLIEARVIVA